jgi:glutathione synthase/RimK-type ligase-like ATP-grasp enzyme
VVVAQGFVSSTFDWRIGILDRRPIYAARYHMARGHWQIQKSGDNDKRRYGKVEAVALSEAPAEAVSVAVRAADFIGDSLYGVDVKDVDGRYLVVEINDNPSIEAGYEDAILRDELYTIIMQSFVDRLDRQSLGTAPR